MDSSSRNLEIAVIGNSVVDQYLLGLRDWPGLGIREMVTEVQIHPGGNGLNTAVVLSKLGGINVKLFTAIGHGGHAQLVRWACERRNPTDHNSKDLLANPVRLILPDGVPTNTRTPVSVIRLDDDRNPSFAHAPGATQYLTHDYLFAKASEFAGIDCLMLTGIGLQPWLQLHELVPLLRNIVKQEQHPMIVADLTLMRRADDSDSQTKLVELSPILPYIDYLLPNEDEAKQWSNMNTIDLAAKVFNSKVRKATVIKRGAEGCWAFPVTAPSFAVPSLRPRDPRRLDEDLAMERKDYVRDTTGAGDAFAAGFISAMLREAHLPEPARLKKACEIGNATACLAIQAIGSTSNVRAYADTLAYLEENRSRSPEWS